MDKRIQARLTAARILRLVIAVILFVLAGRTFKASGQTETNLWSFGSTPNNGRNPSASLVQGTDGNFYGTTEYGGTNGCDCGTVFRISPSGTYTTLYSFAGPPDGEVPWAGLVQGSDGNFYGTTRFGGWYGDGTVFRISLSGNYTNLYIFGTVSNVVFNPNDGLNPMAGLLQGSDGNFYGTTSMGGGTNHAGTVFKISPSGTYTSLYSFGSQPNDGEIPYAGLVQGSDSNFYGTTYWGGMNNSGTVFRISPSGSETNLYSFGGPPSDGSNPQAGLVQGSDGNFYGTTYWGGTNGSCYNGCGTVFRMSPGGTYTSLYSFVGTPNDGANPYGGVVQGSDGNFYGTTLLGGTNYRGNVFKISPSGNYANLYSFAGYPLDGAGPWAGLVQGSDGNFYGTTQVGGTNNDGIVFKLTVPLNPPANQISEIQFFNVLDSTIVALPVPSVAGETYQLQYSDSMSPVDWINTGGTITSIGGPLVLIDLAEPLPPQRFYRAVITP